MATDCTCPPGAHGPVAGCAAHAIDRIVPPHMKRGDPTRDCGCCGGTGWHLDGDEPDCGVDLRAERDDARLRLDMAHGAFQGAETQRLEAVAMAERQMAAWLAEVEAHRATRALLADALRCGLDEAERLRAERGTLLDAHAEERDVWEASRACDLVAERDAAVSERDHERERHAFWRGLAGSRADGLQVVERERDALARRVATLRTALERAHAAASWGVANAAVVEALAADDAATAGRTTGG